MEYIIHNGTFIPCDSEELMHYGVKGMRWGVRRNTRLLSSSNSAKREKAVAKLQKHRDKGSAAIAKLQKKGVKLEKKQEKRIIKDETKAAKINQKAAKLERKAYGRFTSDDKAMERLQKSEFLKSKANALTARANSAKAKVNKNKAMISAFEREVNNIDKAMAENGRKYING